MFNASRCHQQSRGWLQKLNLNVNCSGNFAGARYGPGSACHSAVQQSGQSATMHDAMPVVQFFALPDLQADSPSVPRHFVNLHPVREGRRLQRKTLRRRYVNHGVLAAVNKGFNPLRATRPRSSRPSASSHAWTVSSSAALSIPVCTPIDSNRSTRSSVQTLPV